MGQLIFPQYEEYVKLIITTCSVLPRREAAQKLQDSTRHVNIYLVLFKTSLITFIATKLIKMWRLKAYSAIPSPSTPSPSTRALYSGFTGGRNSQSPFIEQLNNRVTTPLLSDIFHF